MVHRETTVPKNNNRHRGVRGCYVKWLGEGWWGSSVVCEGSVGGGWRGRCRAGWGRSPGYLKLPLLQRATTSEGCSLNKKWQFVANPPAHPPYRCPTFAGGVFWVFLMILYSFRTLTLGDLDHFRSRRHVTYAQGSILGGPETIPDLFENLTLSDLDCFGHVDTSRTPG